MNVLVYAHNSDEPKQPEFNAWLVHVLAGPEPFGISSVVLSEFLRIVTHPSVLPNPMTPAFAVEAAERIRMAPAAAMFEPGPRHWSIFGELCRKVEAKGNTVPDAYLAALAIEHGCRWYTTDRGFARFPGLRWRHPLSE